MNTDNMNSTQFYNYLQNAYDGIIPDNQMKEYRRLEAKERGENYDLKMAKVRIASHIVRLEETVKAAKDWFVQGHNEQAKRMFGRAIQIADEIETALINIKEYELGDL